MTTVAAIEQQQDLASLIELYLLRCQVEGKSPNTITAYRETLTLFERIAGEEEFPEGVRAITPVHIYAYLGRIGSNGASLETRHRRHQKAVKIARVLGLKGGGRSGPGRRIAALGKLDRLWGAKVSSVSEGLVRRFHAPRRLGQPSG
jgi:hypothetical protein